MSKTTKQAATLLKGTAGLIGYTTAALVLLAIFAPIAMCWWKYILWLVKVIF